MFLFEWFLNGDLREGGVDVSPRANEAVEGFCDGAHSDGERNKMSEDFGLGCTKQKASEAADGTVFN